MIVVKGAAGAAEFQEPLNSAADKWQEAAKKGEMKSILIEGENSKKSFLETIKNVKAESAEPLWIVLLGHGTYLNGMAKMNLTGEDLSAEDLKNSLKDLKREVILINCASASAPFLVELSGPERVIVTATKNQAQIYYTKFNEIMAEAISAKNADFDKEGQTSLLESYLFASHKVKEFYQADKRIQGENALIDDNGDKKGSLLEMFSGLNPKKSGAKIDGFRAHQLHLIPSDAEKKMNPELQRQRDNLELQLHKLKLKKASMNEELYYKELELILKKLAKIYNQN